MNRYPHLAARLYNTPLMVHPDKAVVLEAVLHARATGAPLPANAAIEYQESAERKSYRVTKGGIAIVPVTGTLVHRGDAMDALSGLISYRRLARQLADAEADAAVRGVLLELDTPGGEVAGLFSLAAAIRASRKPMWSIANEDAYSAGFALATSTSRIYTPRTGGVGSIGVIMLHMDQSMRDEKEGRRYTAIFAGARKNDFSAHAPLSDEAKSIAQAMVDDIYSLFVAHVATGRTIDEDAVRATEAGIFGAPDALDRKLIDGIATLDETVERFEREVSAKTTVSFTRASARSTHGEPAMDNPENIFTQADLDRARAEGERAGRTVGAQEERERVSAILNHAEAAGRGALVTQCITSGLTAEQAGAMLAAAPKAAGNAFADAMAVIGNPDIGADKGGDKNDEAAEAQRIVGLFQPKK